MRAGCALAALACALMVGAGSAQARTPYETARIMAERIMAPDHRTLSNRGLVVMSDNPPPAAPEGEQAGEASAGESRDAGLADGAAERLAPPELLSSMVGVTAVDTGFPEFADSLMDVVGRSLDAGMADEVLASIGRSYRGRMAMLNHQAAVGERDPFHAKAPGALPGDAPDMTFQQLTNHNFGSARWMAVGVSHKFNGLSSVTTNVQLQHTTGPVDVEVKVTGWQGLSMAQSMSLSYDSIALVDLSQNLKVGMVARGSLGTLGALNPSQDQVAGPVARFKLFGNGTSLSAETGYTFRIRQENDPSLNRFHANLNLNVKL
ncbi:hypothetical protein [Novosphingobium sp.]|uniref:hypothetical protein n=1 Tax=Novosphingobium sp. TaxID=1874826 RepID=UPI0031E3C771